jgi:hypothetical protein
MYSILRISKYQLNQVFLKEWHLFLVQLTDSGNTENDVMLTQKEGDSILRNGGDREEEDNS